MTEWLCARCQIKLYHVNAFKFSTSIDQYLMMMMWWSRKLVRCLFNLHRLKGVKWGIVPSFIHFNSKTVLLSDCMFRLLLVYHSYTMELWPMWTCKKTEAIVCDMHFLYNNSYTDFMMCRFMIVLRFIDYCRSLSCGITVVVGKVSRIVLWVKMWFPPLM